jgi:hypothetical protein
MAKPTDQQFDTAFRAYEHYVAELHEFVEAMVAAVVQVRNVEPFANFAEMLVDGRLKTSDSPVRVIDLRGRLPIQIVDSPPPAPAVGE